MCGLNFHSEGIEFLDIGYFRTFMAAKELGAVGFCENTREYQGSSALYSISFFDRNNKELLCWSRFTRKTVVFNVPRKVLNSSIEPLLDFKH
ncbi:MAG: hypothetical protein QM500_19845 [Methylococcales bacterium]